MRPSHWPSVSVFIVALWLAATASVAQSQSPTIQKLLAPGAEENDTFGAGGVISANWLIVGAPGDNDAHDGAGALYAYARVGGAWSLVQKLYAHDGAVQTGWDGFGGNIAMAGNLLAASAMYDTNPAGLEAGSVYLFANQGGLWVQIQRIYSLDCGYESYFGRSVALSANVLVVAAPFADGVSTHSGSVFVFEPQGGKWVQTAELLPSDGQPGFGNSPVAASDDTILVGRPYFGAGAVFVFEKVGGVWQETDRLDPPTPQAQEEFGAALALDGSRALILAPAAGPASHLGEAYVFERGPAEWSLTATLTGNDSSHSYMSLQAQVALDGDRAAFGDGPTIYDFALLSGTWTHVAQIVPPDPDPMVQFGTVLSLSGHDLLAGAWEDSSFGMYSGAAYAIQLVEPITFLDLGWALAGVNGVPQLSPTGVPLPGKLVQLTLSHGKPGATGALILSATQLNQPTKGGVLVPFPDAILAVGTDALGSATLSGAWPAGIPSGAIIAMQWWTADAAGIKGFAASNAIGALAP